MALEFPLSASVNQIYQSGSSPVYIFNGSYWVDYEPNATTVLSSVSSSFAVSSSRSFTSSFSVSSSRSVSSSLTVTSSVAVLEYAVFTLTSYPTTAPNDISLVRVDTNSSAGITYASNIITLVKPGVYRLYASIPVRASNASSYGWVDTSNVKLPGTADGSSADIRSTDTLVDIPSGGIYTTTSANTQIKLRLLGGATIPSGAAQYAVYCHVTILQIR